MQKYKAFEVSGQGALALYSGLYQLLGTSASGVPHFCSEEGLHLFQWRLSPPGHASGDMESKADWGTIRWAIAPLMSSSEWHHKGHLLGVVPEHAICAWILSDGSVPTGDSQWQLGGDRQGVELVNVKAHEPSSARLAASRHNNFCDVLGPSAASKGYTTTLSVSQNTSLQPSTQSHRTEAFLTLNEAVIAIQERLQLPPTRPKLVSSSDTMIYATAVTYVSVAA